MEHFFRIYKELERKEVETLGWEGREVAHNVVRQGISAALHRKVR
ncbi:MAG: inorganic diphosphatase [Deltaproteobacteria bacterium]|nr:MAG: inorganic diphosphatase [Deltaproteobacteria bacterium]